MGVRGGRAEARTRKSAVTREKMMEAAAELMVERGGTDFQMMEVSSRCEMSKGSLYYYFADKGELVRAVMDRSVEALVDAVERVVADAPSAADSILGLVRALAEALRPGGPLMLAMLGSGTSATGAPAVEGPRLARPRHPHGPARARQGGGARPRGRRQPPLRGRRGRRLPGVRARGPRRGAQERRGAHPKDSGPRALRRGHGARPRRLSRLTRGRDGRCRCHAAAEHASAHGFSSSGTDSVHMGMLVHTACSKARRAPASRLSRLPSMPPRAVPHGEKNRREEPATLLPAPERVVAVLTCGRGVGAAAFGYHH